ncbi:MAG TPA: ATP-binding protein [Casimicrobiaceae bacterium]|nr:ATP-binding protein [Casimicrobiaceae bacterium]
MTIRAHLLLLAIGAALPVLAFALVLSAVLVEQDRRTFERGATDRARAMMTAVDAELRGSIATVLAITASPALQANDLASFHDEAARLLVTQPSWLDITLSRPSGEKVVDAAKPLSDAGMRVIDPESVARAVTTRGVVIGNVDRLDKASPPGIPIRVPVVVDGRIAYVLTAIVRPDSFEDLIRQQRLPGDWISGIVDARGNFVARIPPRPAGERAGAAFRAAVSRAPEGWYRGPTVEGKDTFSAYERSQLYDWSIGLAIPAELVEAGAWRTSWLMGIGVLSSIVVAFAIATVLGRRIAVPIAALASVAQSVGLGRAGSTKIDEGVREVTDVAVALREADAAVSERAQLIEREKHALQNADRAKDEFIATLSHELRNPLAALTAAAHILRMTDATHAAAADARGVIERQTKHMSRMIEDLLDVSRLIAGKVHLMPETFDLATITTTTVGAWRSARRFGDRNVTLDTQSTWVRADRTRTEQILANLLDNAIKFTPPRGHISISVASEDDAAVLRVADDGEGIAPALLERVFDVFVQGSQDASRSKGGIGLGLTLVKRLAELQGGSVGATSAGVARGATFTVQLPAAAPVAALIGAPTTSHAASPCRIVIVEDNDDAREMLREVLAMAGHSVGEAANGTAGVDLAREIAPDLAIIDIGLPDIDGYEVARRVRAQSTRPISLIALTGFGQPEDLRRAREAGFDLHLVKPVTVERLDHAIATLETSSSAQRVAD